MDALARHDMELHQRTTPEERLAQALELMRVGIRLQRTKLAHRYPSETEEQIAERLLDWLQSMTEVGDEDLALKGMVRVFRTTCKPFELVGGLAVSVRAEVHCHQSFDVLLGVEKPMARLDVSRATRDLFVRLCGHRAPVALTSPIPSCLLVLDGRIRKKGECGPSRPPGRLLVSHSAFLDSGPPKIK